MLTSFLLKKHTSTCFILFVVLGSASVFGQCPERDVFFNTQEQVDSFAINYPNCSAIQGVLNIGNQWDNDSIANLSSLKNLTSIVGHLKISGNVLLKNLSGLENLHTIHNNIIISGNDALQNLNGLNNLTKVDGTIYISGNRNLTDISALSNLSKIGKGLTISHSYKLKNLDGLQNIDSIRSDLNIIENPMLNNLDGLENLNSIGGDLNISINATLNNLNGLENLSFISENLNIEGNRMLNSLSGLNNLNELGGHLNFDNNDALTDISNLENLKSIRSIIFKGNFSLKELTGLFNIESITGYVKIENNYSLSNLSWLQNINSISNTLYITKNNSLIDLRGLENIESLGGLSVSWNKNLNSLSGIENLSSIHGNISIEGNELLSNINVLKNIDHIGEGLLISRNNSLTNLSGLANLGSVGQNLSVSHNDRLENLIGLENLIHIGNNLSIYKNQNLLNLEGLRNLSLFGGKHIYIKENDLLSFCKIDFFCNNFSQDIEIAIEKNNTGCNSKAEIVTNCKNLAKIVTKIFHDANQNKVKDDGEIYITYGKVNISPNKKFIISNPVSEETTIFVKPENYLVELNEASLSNWRLTTDSASYQLNLAEGDCQTVSFGVYPNQIISEIQSTVHSPNTRCNDTIPFDISTKNLGTTIAKGVIWFSVDSIINTTKFVDQPDTIISPNQYGWFFDNLLPSQLVSRQIKLGIPGVEQFELGDSLTFKSYVEFADENGEQQSKTNTYQTLVRCSFDPNDKLVNPNRTCSHILMDENITYTIRFQNTGNDVAYKVSITDEIDVNLDLNTFSLVNSSHIDSLQTSITDNGTVTFEFNNINLPDSTSNLEGSQGYVSYSIKVKTGLPENTLIKNTSAIYFDYNPRIITNTVENILVSELPNITWCQDVNENGLGNPNESIESCEQPEGYVMDCSDLNDLVSIEEESISDAITIYPNPSTGVFRLAVGHANFRKATFSLYNANGQLIVEPTALNQRELSLTYPDLGNGVYYITLSFEDEFFQKKLVVLK